MKDQKPVENQTEASQLFPEPQSKSSNFWKGFALGVVITLMVGLGVCFSLLAGY